MNFTNIWSRLRAFAYKSACEYPTPRNASFFTPPFFCTTTMSFSIDKDSKIPTENNEDFDDDQIAEVMRDQATGEISEAAVRAEGEEKVTWFVWILVLASSISGLLFGKTPREL
jgi:hypothetical protein